MGNNAYKKEEAIRFNEDRAYRLKKEAERKADMKANPEKYRVSRKSTRKLQAFLATALAAGGISETANAIGENSRNTKPTPIKDWYELAKVPDSATHTLDITPEEGNGWVVEIETGENIHYMSTHTFYGKQYKHSTHVLQSYGFNVTINNWDK